MTTSLFLNYLKDYVEVEPIVEDQNGVNLYNLPEQFGGTQFAEIAKGEDFGKIIRNMGPQYAQVSTDWDTIFVKTSWFRDGTAWKRYFIEIIKEYLGGVEYKFYDDEDLMAIIIHRDTPRERIEGFLRMICRLILAFGERKE